MKYAIIEIGGKQLWVESGKFYSVNYLATEPGNKLLLNRVLMVNNGGTVELGKPYLENVQVHATVLEHFRGPKIIVYKMKPKKKMRRKQGHRQQLTRFMVDNIVMEKN